MDTKGHQSNSVNNQRVTYPPQPPFSSSDTCRSPAGSGNREQVNYSGFTLNSHDPNIQHMANVPGDRSNINPAHGRNVDFLPQGAVSPATVHPQLYPVLPPYSDPPPPYPGINYQHSGFGSQPSMATSLPFPIERFQREFTPEQQCAISKVLGGSINGSIWLAYRLAALKNYELHFIIDNSISMDTRDGMVHPVTEMKMTRLEEAVYRLGNVADLLAHIPVMGIKIQSFTEEFLPIDTRGTPAAIAMQMKRCLDSILWGGRESSTPLYPAMLRTIKESERSPQSPPRIIYVFNDGEPNEGGSKDRIFDLLQHRKPERSPVCLVACTSVRPAVKWMNEADEQPNVHVVDDFQAEMREVKEHQGARFPFTEGFYLMSTLLGPIDPLFDKADENHIFDSADYQEICGRKISRAEYDLYQEEAYQLQNSHARNEAYRRQNRYAENEAYRLQNRYAENNDNNDSCLIS
ncbi:hypothetical protein [Endozoicomonas sp. YOMI1]|uniref:hypothetical protein n=1 Tax=Endozoicomonas sp. YOMI1 TaxID=2828739 RepID=UPI002148AE7A|nr:hypothetical protein [Endozoicomonas sp. YOMI1]